LADTEDIAANAPARVFSHLSRGTTYESYQRYYEAKGLRTYLLRSALAPFSSWRWNRFITAFHARVGAPPPLARVLAKPLRSYLCAGLGPRQRVATLIEGYECLEARFNAGFLARFCAGDKMPLFSFEARKGARFTLFCSATVDQALQREGEIALFLVKADPEVTLCRIATTFAKVDGKVTMTIGGLQGPQSAHKRDVIDSTREMYGLRPKDAALLVARAFAQAAGAEALHAVSDANHVLARLQDTAKFSSYDAYWLERGASAGGPYGFIFPPLGDDDADDSKRSALKRSLIEATRAFVRANGRNEA